MIDRTLHRNLNIESHKKNWGEFRCPGRVRSSCSILLNFVYFDQCKIVIRIDDYFGVRQGEYNTYIFSKK